MVRGKPVDIEIDTGVANAPDDAKDADTLVALADANVYEAQDHRRAGRPDMPPEPAAASPPGPPADRGANPVG